MPILPILVNTSRKICTRRRQHRYYPEISPTIGRISAHRLQPLPLRKLPPSALYFDFIIPSMRWKTPPDREAEGFINLVSVISS